MNHHVIESMLRPLSRLAQGWAQGWAENSQQKACRNAMVASTALAASRQEREEVQLFVEDVLARRADAAAASTPPTAAQLG